MPDPVPDAQPPSTAPGNDTSVRAPDETSGERFTMPQTGLPLYPFLGPPAAPGHLGTLGRYHVVEKLGEGGMGFVFRGEDVKLGRPVALKVMRPEVAARPQAFDRFLREARSAAAVKDDHVVVIYEFGDHNGLPFMAMELLGGSTLEDWLTANGGAASPEVAVRFAKDALRGLGAAHARGLFHRDIKPSNLWVEASGRVKVLDFGLTRGRDDGLTAENSVLGTPAYMSPEQADGHPVDARTDLFSLGTVLYRMLTGGNPFARGSALPTLKAVTADEPMPLSTAAPWVPDHLAAFVHRLLCKKLAGRPDDARAALAELCGVEDRLSGVQVDTAPAVVVPADGFPPVPEHIFGRDALIGSVAAQVRAGGLVVLRGEGGMGKTTLAAAVAHAVRGAGPAAWVNCERTPRFEECVRLAAAALLGDRHESESVEALAPRVAAHLTSRAGLLVLDNFESAAGDPAMVRWAAAFRTGARVLVTTREVPPGLGGRVVPVHELARPDAVKLFRARAADAGLVAPPPAEIVDALCARVGDQPLAIELLAVRAARTPARRLLERVRKSLDALDADADATRPERHRGVRACFAESFAELTPTARELLVALSVLPAPFGLDLLSAVAARDDWDEAADELVAASLWRLAGDRYSAHPLVRQLANEELGAGREVAERTAARRVADAARARRADLRAAGADRERTKAYLNWCGLELPNLVAVADAAFARGDWPVVTAVADALSAYWSARGYWDVAHRLYQSAITAAVSSGDRAAEAWGREYHGFVSRHIGRFADGETAYRAALAICDEHPAAEVHRGRILARFGKLLSVVGRYAEATKTLEDALEWFARADNSDGLMMTTTYLAQVHKFSGDLPRAEELFLRALERARRKGDGHRQCEALFQLGNTYLRMGRFDDADRCLGESLGLARSAEDRIRESQNLVDLGIVATRRGAWDRAEQFLSGGLQITRDLNLRLYEGRTMRRMAEMWVARGMLDRAREYALSAVNILESSEDRWAQSRARDTLRAIEDAIAGRAAPPEPDRDDSR